MYALLLAVGVSLAGCSLKKNTASTRRYMAFITRYNIYYNGDTHYKETLGEMEGKYEDDYTRMVFMHPVEGKSDPKAPQPTGNFDRSIEKAQKAIQLRSIKKKPKKKSGKGNDPEYKAWMKRDEYNPFLHNAWMMMGRSQYYNGDFLGAASTFFYISKHFTWLPNTVTEAKLWQARSYCSLDWAYDAELIVSKIKPDELTNKTLKGLYNFVYADYYLHRGEWAEAVPYLKESIRYAKGAQKTRLNFLLGQVYSRIGEKGLAYQAYKKAGSATSASYRTKFNARIKQSEVYSGENIEKEVKALKRMTRYDRNAEYLDQIYYAIGNLYLSRNDTLKAIENYKLAAEKSKRNGIDKAISQVTLGQLYYERHEYDLAQPCFAEAVPQLPESYPNYEMIKKRSDVLDELAVYAQNVQLNDSLLRLSNMSEEEQLKVVNKIIDELKKKEKEEAEAAAREEYLAEQAANGNNMTQSNANAPTSFQLNTDDSWYFYNTATKNAGKTEFQKRWGSRKLEDDWRRRNKASFSMDDFGDTSDEEDEESDETEENGDDSTSEESAEEKAAAKRAEDPHYPEYYLKQIPKTDQERQVCNDIIQEGLYNMGVILKDKLEDYPAALSEFGRLLTRYPDNVYRLDAYYNMYLIYMRENKPGDAERYRQLILTDFADSKYGKAMVDEHYLDNLKAMPAHQEAMYEQAYDAYMENDNASVHSIYNEMRRKYPMSKIMPKFMFLEALSYVTENEPEKFKETLKELLELYPETDITPMASSYLKQLNQGRKLHSGPVNMRGMLWDIHLGTDSAGVAGSDQPANFELNPDSKQLLVLTYPTDSVSSNQLLYDIASHNFATFVVRDFDLEQMNFGRLGMLIIKGFANQRELDHYRNTMSQDRNLKLPPQVRPIIISEKNFETLLKEGRSLDEYFRFIDEQNYREAQENVLPAEVFGESETLSEREEYDAEEAREANGWPIEIEPVETTPPAKEDVKAEAESDGEAEIKAEIKAEGEAPAEASEAKPSERPVTKPSEKPVAKPAERPVAKPAAKPTMPEYPAGSEGDDPLFD